MWGGINNILSKHCPICPIKTEEAKGYKAKPGPRILIHISFFPNQSRIPTWLSCPGGDHRRQPSRAPLLVFVDFCLFLTLFSFFLNYTSPAGNFVVLYSVMSLFLVVSYVTDIAWVMTHECNCIWIMKITYALMETTINCQRKSKRRYLSWLTWM